MSPSELKNFLARLVKGDVTLSTMIWGAPGIGKSSIVAEVARDAGLELVDVRLSQLAPTDLRGLPVPRHAGDGGLGTSLWYPPEFLPRGGRGILLLDELNMAPPSMQGVAQQLILDRKVGSYTVPEGWFIWAAGNRKEDKASVFEMPAPLANRFLHVQVDADFDSFRNHALEQGVPEQLLAFLSFRPELLHKVDPTRPAWPSPRSWMMASRLLKAGLPIHSAVGDPAASEYKAYLAVYRAMPDLDAIVAGQGDAIDFPTEMSTRYAVSIGLVIRSETAKQAFQALRWMARKAPPEWTQRSTIDMSHQLRHRKGQPFGAFAVLASQDADLSKFVADLPTLMAA